MNKDTKPEGFSLSLAIFDAFPVLLFGIDMIIIGKKFNSILFVVGSFLCLFAGMAKVLWKIIAALKEKNIWILFIQMRYLMPLGFVMILTSLIMNYNAINISAFIRYPQVIFYLLFLIGMSLMVLCSIKLDSQNIKNNWIEQTINTLAQLSLLIGLLI